jgi:putative PIN family toxin of toxin-antitoxin system
MKAVVFDTNVVVAAAFWNGAPRRCLEAWARGEFSAVVSPELLAEYAEIVERLRPDYPDREPVPWAAALAEAAELVFPTVRLAGLSPDPDDDMVLECAVTAEAGWLVTGDKKHLLPLGEVRGVDIVTPTRFLELLKTVD